MEKRETVLEQFVRVFNQLNALQRTSSAAYRGEKLYASELQVLALLAERPMIKISDISSTLYFTVSAASQLVKKLTARGLIEKKRNIMNERMIHLVLSPEGEKLAAETSGLSILSRITESGGQIHGEEERILSNFLTRVENSLDSALREKGK
ncbi:MAG: MarR family transcriptional regulator [Spirochaetales bacterium]|nr:MarR family transcriptional regulator [Spirochaetales bacterium]